MSILEKLKDQSIVSIKLFDDKREVCIKERCDSWFSLQLNKKEFGQFISELQDIHNIMEE